MSVPNVVAKDGVKHLGIASKGVDFTPIGVSVPTLALQRMSQNIHFHRRVAREHTALVDVFHPTRSNQVDHLTFLTSAGVSFVFGVH
jgi:hypothetical protein